MAGFFLPSALSVCAERIRRAAEERLSQQCFYCVFQKMY
jgi:hypothetical protein